MKKQPKQEDCPLNALEFLKWLESRLNEFPYEMRAHIDINIDHLDRFGHPYLSLDFKPQTKDIAIISTKATLLSLTEEQRLEMLNEFCHSCGTADPKCQCGNDE